MPSFGGMQRTRGASAVEFALVVPVFLLILLFMIDAGRVLFVQAALQDSAHQGARAAAVGASAPEVIQLSRDTGIAALSVAAAGQAALAVTVNPACPLVYDPLNLDVTSVEVSADFTFFTPISLIQQFDPGATRPGTITLSQRAEWLCEG